MTTRADWFIGQVESGGEGESDPFAMPVQEVGVKIDLRDPKAALDLQLAELVHRESYLFNAGITCPIKDRADSTCHACPVSQAHDKTKPLGRLCRIGRAQETVLTELAVLACPDR